MLTHECIYKNEKGELKHVFIGNQKIMNMTIKGKRTVREEETEERKKMKNRMVVFFM